MPPCDVRSRGLLRAGRALFTCLQQQRLWFDCSVVADSCAQIFSDFAQADGSAASQTGNDQIGGNPWMFAHEAQDDMGDGCCGRAVGDGGAEAPFKEALQASLLYHGFTARRRPQ